MQSPALRVRHCGIDLLGSSCSAIDGATIGVTIAQRFEPWGRCMSFDNSKTAPIELLRTPLHGLHVDLGARMMPFAGYDMPVQYPPGVLKEHLHTRRAAGLFDVSHMGQIALRAQSGELRMRRARSKGSFRSTSSVCKPGRQRYAFFTNESGGILDDLMVANRGDHLLLVVNAACKEADEAICATASAHDCDVEPLAIAR